ncbi:MAG: hypothetical protein OK438_01125 [Thaumarchaeota archaeon]|nr:hypothetical protein [Nitrososphaerota archaeon]
MQQSKRAAFCVYIAGKKHGSAKTGANDIAEALKKREDGRQLHSRWNRYRLQSAFERIYASLDKPMRDWIGNIPVTPAKKYVDLIYRGLQRMVHREDELQTLRALRSAYFEAISIYDRTMKASPDFLASRNPRTVAAHCWNLAVREIDWKKLRVRKENIVGASQISEASGIPKRSFVSLSKPKGIRE